ncbi:unnamed protein product [Coffea canephora]|uniref:Uncharacterized protein n=1 Tax=Coffea canephora TaxID=49390 RepID=A0A068V4P4_COFCA|nr:unnamed protein product [Coffea canephora]
MYSVKVFASKLALFQSSTRNRKHETVRLKRHVITHIFATSRIKCTTSSDSKPHNPVFHSSPLKPSCQKNFFSVNPVTQSQSPKLGRKLSSRTMQGTMPVSLPPPATSLNKNGGISKHVSGKNGRTATSFPASRPEIINHENASPNIPY